MSGKSQRSRAEHIKHIMETEGDAVATNTRGFNEGRYESVAKLEDYEALKDRAREIKEDAIERLPDLIDEVTEAVEENGGTVYIAQDAADANRYIANVCEGEDADRLIKSKSMTSEELEVNEHLEQNAVDVVETDLGEWVLQLAEEAPSHIVAPAIHKSREEIATLFEERFDPDEELESAEELTMFARERLGELIREADVGMTGANFVTADSGTIALVTSEGNARKSVTVPDTQIAVAGVEKIVPSVEDLHPFIELIGRSGTGQDITSYVSLFTPPINSPTVDFEDTDSVINGTGDDRDFHLVLIDNGRMAMREDEDLRETLYCIRCSACSNTCANFQSVGGHVFGGETYSGGIATGWEAGIEGLDTAAEFNDLCTGCSRCTEACPVNIDIPWINTVVRDRINSGTDVNAEFLVDGLTPDAEGDGGGPGLQKRLFGNFETLAKLGSAFAPVSNWVANSTPAGYLLERVAGVDRRREFPAFRRTTLREWHAERGSDADDPEREVVLYPDPYTNYMLVDRGKAAVRLLEALDVAVTIPDVPGSGRAPLSQGMIDTATATAREVSEALGPYVDDGGDVVVIEPSDLAMFRGEYERLLPGSEFEPLAENSYEIVEYVYGLLANGADADALSDGGGESVAYHSHCQQRTLGLAEYTRAVLEECGYDVTTTDVECCGMAGSFGYKRQYYDLSMDVGENLGDQLRAADADRVVASGTSCTDQIGDLLGADPLHPVELLAPEG